MYKAKPNRKHGESRTRLYQIWTDMKNRCTCKANVGYEYYGGRGIKICKSWKGSYVVFREWALVAGYQKNLELDRRNPNRGYYPSNCRWATRTQQMRNTRKRRDAKTSKYKGVSKEKHTKKWKAQIGIDGRVVYIGLFTNEIDAAKAYDSRARQEFGEFARLNFPNNFC